MPLITQQLTQRSFIIIIGPLYFSYIPAILQVKMGFEWW